jgi:glycosyltransferase involved in cell wall biosynthesis
MSYNSTYGGRGISSGHRKIVAQMQDLNPDLEKLLQPFGEHSARARLIVAIDCPWISGVSQNDFGPAIIMPEASRPLADLALQGQELSNSSSGTDLLLLPVQTLHAMMPPVEDDFSFRAVVALFPQIAGQLKHDDDWRLRRSLFDRGLVCVGSVSFRDSKALCFLASEDVQSFNHLDVDSRGHVAISVLRDGAAFGNRLFRYLCAKLYALRHGLTAAMPQWEGKRLFGLEDRSCEGLASRKLHYAGFADDDRELWDMEDPPINIDLDGYFQEIPECWRRHRSLLRNMFQLSPDHVQALDAWREDVTEGGQRTLVAIHVRRGDYRKLQNKDMPWLRLVPEDWYIDWLRKIWPTLRQPVLFVATDEPEAVVPFFDEFEPISATFGAPAQNLPAHIRDFEGMRRADHLAICNSSFSRMASILAPSAQKCFIPSFRTQSFGPYEPWIDPAFWQRFRDSWQFAVKRQVPRSAALSTRTFLRATAEQLPAIFFDVTDLVRYLLHHSTLSGIQRVQCEILSHLLNTSDPQPIRVVVLNERGKLGTIDASALLSLIEEFRSDAAAKAVIESDLRALLDRAIPCTLQPREVFLTIGAFWGVSGMGQLLQRLKTSGAIIGVFIHDIIPIVEPEYFEVRGTRVFVKAVMEALTFADFLFTTSQYNMATLAELMVSRKMDPLPVHVVPLAHAFSPSAPTESKVSSVIAEIAETDYVLVVGTIEVRKNPTYLFNIWKMMVSSGRSNIPTLVFAGRKGWFVQDLFDQLKACNYLGGKIVLVHDATDGELDVLYRKCMLTMFPSFVEGWGLPVGESLAHGKICLCSDRGGIRAVGGNLADYLDPYNVRDGLDRLTQYLDDPELRRSREREIADWFEPRSWRKTSDDFLKSARALARMVRPSDSVAALTLPPNEYVPISSAIAMEGTLSGELICVSGWGSPEVAGVRATEPETTLRFRTDAQVGARVNLLLRLAAYGRDFRVRLHSGSGAQTVATLASGSEKMAVLSCEVEPGNLLTAHLSSIEQTADETPLGATPASKMLNAHSSDASYWTLKGVLYFDPKRVAAPAFDPLNGSARPSSPAQASASATPSLPIGPAQLICTEPASQPDRILLRAAHLDDIRRATSFGVFLQSADTYWPLESTMERDAPIFADHEDRRAFYAGCGKIADAPQVGRIKDVIRLFRRSDQFVSTSRFTEGSVFNRAGVSRGFGYLQTSPPEHTPWLSNQANGSWLDGQVLANAPYYDHTYAIFYNGNLHNYYHWMVEGILCLDILSRAMGPASDLRIALPKSMDICALLDHRESLQSLGFDRHKIVEVADNLIRVREAIWVESDLVQHIPAPYLKDFQQRISVLYANLRTPRNRRLLVARKGPTRKIHNIEQVEAFLSRHDFETVYLEGMSIKDQILLFQSAEFIITPHGAGMANLLFCEPGTKVIELSPGAEIRSFFWMIAEKIGLVYGLQFCTTAVEKTFHSSVIVDINKLQALMRMVDAHY